MGSHRGYRWLCGVLGSAMTLFGLGSFVAFFRYHMPGSAATGLLPVGPNGAYFMAFTGCALVAWGGGLLGVARRPALGRSLGTATALALVLSAVYRMVAWLVGDYAALGSLPRIEAAIFLLLALGFVWLRPPHPESAGPA